MGRGPQVHSTLRTALLTVMTESTGAVLYCTLSLSAAYRSPSPAQDVSADDTCRLKEICGTVCHSRSQDNDPGFFFSQSARHAGASASEASVLDAATRVGAYQVCDSQHRQRALVNAALTYLDVDATFVVERLGNRDREGLQCIAEICSSPMSHKVGGGIPA